jgi:hypothetical protein
MEAMSLQIVFQFSRFDLERFEREIGAIIFTTINQALAVAEKDLGDFFQTNFNRTQTLGPI